LSGTTGPNSAGWSSNCHFDSKPNQQNAKKLPEVHRKNREKKAGRVFPEGPSPFLKKFTVASAANSNPNASNRRIAKKRTKKRKKADFSTEKAVAG
jgi:hypothetical protein